MTGLLTAPSDDLTAAVVPQPLSTQPQYGLIRSARIVVEGNVEPGLEGDVRWVNGISFRPEDCDFGSGLEKCGDDPGTAPTPGDSVATHYPFVIEAEVTSSTFCERTSVGEFERARRKLLAVQSYRLEHELWTGLVANGAGWTANQSLTGSSSAAIEGGAEMGTLAALAELEQFLATTSHERGMVHAQPRTVTYWLNNGAVSERNGLIVTALGTIVVPGAGYPGTGPGSDPTEPVVGTPADKMWAFATGMVQVRLGDIFFQAVEDTDIFAKSTNRWLVRAYRFASANFSPCALGAVYINHSAAERTTTGS